MGFSNATLTFLAGGIEQEREDGVFADVFGDVFLRVIRPHLFLVDVFLEDVAEHVGIDFLLVAARSGCSIKMPMVFVEIIEDALEGLVGNLDVVAVASFPVRERRTCRR